MTEWQYVRSTDTVVDLTCATQLALGRITMPSSVMSLSYSAFGGCYSLTSVDLRSVTTIPAYAFQNCPSLTSVDLRNVTSIGNGTFYDCSSLTSVYLNTVTDIGDNAFYDCSSLNRVTYTAPGTFGDDSLVLVDQDGIVQGPGEEITIDTASDGGGFMTQ